MLTCSSDAILVLRHLNDSVCSSSWPCVLLSLDLCRLWQRKLFLCYYISLELGSICFPGRLDICGAERRVGDRKTGNEREGYQTDIEQIESADKDMCLPDSTSTLSAHRAICCARGFLQCLGQYNIRWLLGYPVPQSPGPW